jgi:FkbM family methyltransferase
MTGVARSRLVWWLLGRAPQRWALRVRGLPLVGPSVHAVSHRLWPTGRRAWVEVETGAARGLAFLLDPRYDAKIASGEIEPELQARLPELIRRGAVVWDVGAHVGFFALTFARLVGPEGLVVAFEADDANVEALRAATQRNQIANVEICPVAVWSAPGTVQFERRADIAGATDGAVVDSGTGVAVPATSLDVEAQQRRIPDLVKIDVEGGEEQVLIGARQLLTEHKPVVVCEVHVHGRGDAELLPRVRALLEGDGYQVEEFDPERRQVHLLATPL